MSAAVKPYKTVGMSRPFGGIDGVQVEWERFGRGWIMRGESNEWTFAARITPRLFGRASVSFMVGTNGAAVVWMAEQRMWRRRARGYCETLARRYAHQTAHRAMSATQKRD